LHRFAEDHRLHTPPFIEALLGERRVPRDYTEADPADDLDYAFSDADGAAE